MATTLMIMAMAINTCHKFSSRHQFRREVNLSQLNVRYDVTVGSPQRLDVLGERQVLRRQFSQDGPSPRAWSGGGEEGNGEGREERVEEE